MLNPGGSVKDRVALQIMQEAFTSGRLKPGGLITEGTAGSTGKNCLPKRSFVAVLMTSRMHIPVACLSCQLKQA